MESKMFLGLLVLSLPLGGGQAPAEQVELVGRLLGQLDVAIQHVVLGRFAADLKDLRTQAHQALNVLVGRGGPGYDPQFGDPGDGVGLVVYAKRLNRGVANLDQRYRLIADNVLFFTDSS
ncbi:MAG: hypothetical protein ACE5LD_04625, partial [Candidatus Bipolaricaulia bacterium]